jgi:hypothetical protein
MDVQKVPTVGILTDHTSRNAPVGNDGVNVWLVMHSTQSANVKDMVRLPTLTQGMSVRAGVYAHTCAHR